MSLALNLMVAALGGYLIGSFPSGLVAGRLVRGEDIRRYGSGRLGATNAFRALGPWVAIAVGLADVLKGVLPVLLAGSLLGSPEAQAVAALAAVVGHNWPVFASFRGGRGTATSWGALLAMAPPLAAPSAIVFALTLLISRYASLASLLGAVVALPAGAYGYLSGMVPFPYLVYTTVGATLVILRHHDNIARLLAGTERRLGGPVEKPLP